MHQSPDSGHIQGEFLPSRPGSVSNGIVPTGYTDVPFKHAPESDLEQEPSGLIEYWRILRRRKGTVILIAAVGGIIGFLVTVPQTPVYQVHTSLEIVSLNQNFLNLKESNPVAGSGTSSDSVDIQTQIRILQSDALMDRVIGKFQATDLPAVQPARISAWRKALNLPLSTEADSGTAALSRARGSVKVRAAGQTRIIDITVDSTNPATAAAFANTMTSEFIDQNLEARWKTTQHTGEWLSRELDDMRVRLERSEDRLQQYAHEAGLIFAQDEKTNISQERLSQVQQTLSAAQADRIIKQSRWEMAESSPPDALPDILNDPNLQQYDGKLTELKRQLAELKSTYKDDYSKVQRVQAQIVPIQSALDHARADILKRIRNEYDEALRKQNLLTADYAAQVAIVTGEGGKAIQYNILKREVDSNRQLYDAMLQQLKQATLSSALRASNIRVVDPAKPASRPYKPDIPSSTGIGMLSGLFLGVAFVVMQERADRSIQEPGDSPIFLNLPELGIVPAESASRLRIPLIKGENDDMNGVPQNGSGARGRVELVTWQRKPSPLAESFRATLVSILFSGVNGTRPQVMAITSASPAEGKSTVVSNLGIAVAEVNQKVLLIDADLRKPRLHDIFGLKNEKGLSELLRSNDPVSDLLEGAVQSTHVPNLFILTSGSATQAATSLLYSNRMPELIRMLRAEFETIFIDTPPMLQIPDARVVGRMVDRVILVLRAGKTTRSAALAARHRFSEDGTQILGTILNDWNAKRSPNGYYGNYNGYYHAYNGYYNGNGHRKTETD